MMSSFQEKSSLNILLWRNWEPLYAYPAVFSSLKSHSVGGTCSQLLWHARNLKQMGHHVQVLGTTQRDIVEEDIEFIGAVDASAQKQAIISGRVQAPDVIFLEGAFAAAEFFRTTYPKAKIIHVGQNIDQINYKQAFRVEKFLDLYGFVGLGKFADYCHRFPHLRHKFMLLRNIVPWQCKSCCSLPSFLSCHASKNVR